MKKIYLLFIPILFFITTFIGDEYTQDFLDLFKENLL
jgi:hypothetical protein